MDEAMPSEKILVVDDAPQNVKLLRLILSDAGYKVIEAFSGEEALRAVEHERPDAMVLDVRMPGMTGYDVCAKLRANPEFRAFPIIMVTALSMQEERIKGIEVGATDFITKPFNKRELLARLASSLAMSGAEKAVGSVPINEPVILTDPQWQILEATPLAAGYLGVSSASARGMNFREILQQQSLTPPKDTACDGWTFHLRTTNEFGDLAARSTDVRAPDGRLVLRVITLREEPRAFA